MELAFLRGLFVSKKCQAFGSLPNKIPAVVEGKRRVVRHSRKLPAEATGNQRELQQRCFGGGSTFCAAVFWSKQSGGPCGPPLIHLHYIRE